MDDDEMIETGLKVDDLAKLFPLNRKNPNDPGARITSTFCITGDPLSFDKCTAAVGIKPTETKEKRTRGRKMPSGLPNVLPAVWYIEVEHEPSYEVDQCVTELLNIIFPRIEQIKALLSKESYVASISTYVLTFEDGDSPFYSLSASNIKRLAAFDLDWDLYID